tara:strand:+ start:11809 stop:12537 length:729 start_codon:yes stop_codon:yes gene_type:complete
MIKKKILKIINAALKILNIKIVKNVDQFSNTYRLCLAFKEQNITEIYDIGANEGQFAKDLRYYGYTHKIISFEPLSIEHAKLNDNSKNDENWEVYERVAIGDENKNIEINISKNSVSSSILNIKNEHIDAAPESRFVSKQKVNQVKLNDVFKKLSKNLSNSFLKIDTQGYEFQVLKGADQVLSNFKGLLVEVSLAELYEGQKNWIDIIDYLKSLGFKIWSIDRGFTNKKNGKTLQVDLVFFR